MAGPLLSAFPKSARAAFPFIQSGVRRGLSTRAIEQSIRKAGIPVSRARTIVPLARELRAIEQAGRNIRNIGKTRTINVDRLPLAVTRQRRRYAFIVRITGIDAEQGLIERHVTVSTDRKKITPEELEAAAEQMALGEGESGSLQDVSATLQFGTRQA